MAVTVIDNGPIKVDEVVVKDMFGNIINSQPPTFLCRCGLSGKKPFCDGAHKGKFESVVSEKKIE